MSAERFWLGYFAVDVEEIGIIRRLVFGRFLLELIDKWKVLWKFKEFWGFWGRGYFGDKDLEVSLGFFLYLGK